MTTDRPVRDTFAKAGVKGASCQCVSKVENCLHEMMSVPSLCLLSIARRHEWSQFCEPVGQLEMVGQQLLPPIACQHLSGEGCLQPGSRAKPVCCPSVRGNLWRCHGGKIVAPISGLSDSPGWRVWHFESRHSSSGWYTGYPVLFLILQAT